MDGGTTRAGMGKLGGGWCFGVRALEGGIFDLGKAGIRPSGERLRMNGGALAAAGYLPFDAQVERLLRAGLADVRPSRTGDATRSRYGAVGGLGLLVRLAPALGAGTRLRRHLRRGPARGHHHRQRAQRGRACRLLRARRTAARDTRAGRVGG